MLRSRMVVPVLITPVLMASTTAHAGGDAEKGRAIVEQHCSRCHVIGDKNRMGGIGSTPSFPLLRRMPDWRERFETFYARRPHPVHVRVEGVKKWSDTPSNAAEIRLSITDVDHVLAYVESFPASR